MTYRVGDTIQFTQECRLQPFSSRECGERIPVARGRRGIVTYIDRAGYEIAVKVEWEEEPLPSLLLEHEQKECVKILFTGKRDPSKETEESKKRNSVGFDWADTTLHRMDKSIARDIDKFAVGPF